MTITFSGHDLLLEDPEGRVEEFVRSYSAWPHATINAAPRAISPDSYCKSPNWPQPPALKPNQLYYPSGASRWARGLFLCCKETLDSIVNDSTGVVAFNNSYPSTTVTPELGSPPWDLGSQFGVRLHKLEPIPVSDSGDDTLWILPLVDERYWWQGKTIVSVAETWTALFEELSAAMAAGTGVVASDFAAKPWSDGVYASYDEVPLADPDVSRPDPCMFRQGPIGIGPAMDLLCWSLGLRFVPGPLEMERPGYRLMARTSAVGYPGSFNVVATQLDAATANDKPGPSAGGSGPENGLFSDVPYEVKMRFVDTPADPATETYSKTVVNQSTYSGEARYEIWSPAVATSGSPPGNATVLDDLALEWAAAASSWWQWQFNHSLNQMPLWRFSGFEDYVLFDNSRVKGSNYVSLTKIRTLPKHYGYEYVGLQLPGYETRSCGGGGVGGKIWFKVISISDYYWEVPGCEYIRAEVTQKSCNANVAIGDVVYIFDPFFCWFNLPIAIMMRITGTATFAENGFWDGVTPLVCGVTPGKCFWSVDSVCCLEEDYGTL